MIPKISKPPTRSECLRILRQAFGPRTRFARLGEGVAIVAYTETGHEFHVAEVSAKVGPDGRAGNPENLPWYATLAAFRAHGFRVEKTARGWEVYAVGDAPKVKPPLWGRLMLWIAAVAAKVRKPPVRELSVCDCFDLACYDDVEIADDGTVKARLAVDPKTRKLIPEGQLGPWRVVGKLAQGVSLEDARAQVVEAYGK